MIYRLDSLSENNINPITRQVYDDLWMILMLTESPDYQQICGSTNDCAYTIKMSRRQYENWEMAVGDFIDFCKVNKKNAILVMSETDFSAVKRHYRGHSYNEPLLREYEPSVLVHSTSMNSWKRIQNDGMLKSWNMLKSEKAIDEEQPIGIRLGDPTDFSDYIMFGGGVTGEIVVNSKQQGKIVMDTNAEYLTGARLYFDAKRMAQDGLLVRDGCHLKVKDKLPLEPYLIWTATWETIGLASQVSTPRIFAEQADKRFQPVLQNYNSQELAKNSPAEVH